MKRREELKEGGMESGEDNSHNEGASTAHTGKPQESTKGAVDVTQGKSMHYHHILC